MWRKRLASLMLTGLIAMQGAASALAADIKVLTAGAFKPVVVALAPEFERQTGHHLVVDNDTAGALARRIAGGERFDLVVLTEAAIGQLAKDGKLAAGASAPLARVAYIDPAAGGSSGVYLAQLFDKLGIAAQVKAKAVLVPGGLVAQRVVSGDADIAIHQISEILAVPDAVLVGPIPAEIQNYTVYAGGVSAAARDPAAAKALLAVLRGEAARAAMKARGMEAAEPVAGQ
jgi:molybdate transport system substrate-binding protein